MGRWTTPDPLSYTAGPNLYAYLQHNPLNNYDPYGLLGEAFQDFCKPEFSKTYFEPQSYVSFDLDRTNNDRTDYISNDIYHPCGGIAHGGVDFMTNQVQGINSLCCLIGSHEFEDYDERMFAHAAFSQCQAQMFNQFDQWFANRLSLDLNHPAYQKCRYYSNAALEIGSIAAGGYGLVKAQISNLAYQGEKIAGRIALKEVISARTRMPSWDALSKAGQVMDRGGLTKAGRALDKHGNRTGSVFPNAIGNATNKNLQGQYCLDNVLTHPNNKMSHWNHRSFGSVVDIEIPGQGGARFSLNGDFIGFLEP